MRVLHEVMDPRMKISIFSFNEKWIIKTEAGLYEQTYKLPQDEHDFEAAKAIVEDEAFRTAVADRFTAMHKDWLPKL